MKKKTSMTNSDIALILNEFQDKINGFTVDNIYELNDITVLRVKGFTPNFPRQVSIVIEPGKRIHLSEYSRTYPITPSDKVLTFRKFLKKAKITNCIQYGTDRIVVFELEQMDTNRKFSLYCELFGKGNIILVEHLVKDEQPFNKVLFALWYKIMRDRRLLPGKDFIFPPVRGKSFLLINEDDLNNIEDSLLDDQIVKVLVRNFGVSGEVVEEILYSAGIEKSTIAREIIPTRTSDIIKGIKVFDEKLKVGPPLIVYNDATDEFGITFLPFPFTSITGGKYEEFKNFNEAVDQFFSPTEMMGSTEAEIAQVNKIKQLTKQLESQEEHLITLKQDSERKNQIGDVIFAHAHLLEELFSTIITANKKGMPWEDIINRIELGKSRGIESAKICSKLDFSNKNLIVNLNGEELSVDFTSSPYTIGNTYYEASKKAERKIIPALEAINNTKEKLKDAEELKNQAEQISKAKAVKKRVKKWYEAYHWSRTANGFLVIAGRNLKENEQLARKRLDENDLFFHANVQGAPYTILKTGDNDLDNPDLEPTDIDYKDTAIIAGSYSKAWKSGLGSIDVYSVTSTQVSLSAPSGEYLPKGSIAVEGKRTFYKIELKLYFGIYFDETYAYVFVSGNENVIKDRTVIYTSLNAPSHSGEKKSDLAKKMQAYFEKNVNEEDIPKLKTLTLNDYVLIIP